MHKKPPPLPQDQALPSFGRIFGVSEEISLEILFEMGLFKGYGDNKIINRLGWESIAAMFEVKHLVEVEKVQFAGSVHHYVRLGTVSAEFKNPTTIWNKFKKKPRSVPRYSFCAGKSP